MFKHIKSNKGFSLVELMVVVAIIGILAAIAVPTFTGFQQKARTAEGKNLLGSLYVTVKAFEAEGTITKDTNLGLDPLGTKDDGAIYKSYGFDKVAKTGGSDSASSLRSNTAVGDECLYTSSSTWLAGALPHLDNADQLRMNQSRVITHGKDASADTNACKDAS